MTREELWAKFQAGAPLSAIEEQDLAAGLRDDPALRENCLADFQLHGLLRARERTPRDVDTFERSTFRTLEAQSSATHFLKRVESRLTAPKPPTRRRRLLRGGPGSGFSIFSLAAGLLIASLAALMLWHLNSPARPPVPLTRPRNAAPIELPPEKSLPPEPEPTPRPEDPRRQDDDGLRAIASRIREEVQAAEPVEPPKLPEPTPEPPRPPAATQVLIATIDQIGGPVSLLADTRRSPAKAGGAISAGQGLDLGPSSFASLLYPDGTRVDLGPGTRVAEFGEKGIRFDRGSLAAQVAKQKPGQPFVVQTPQGEVRVLGTTLRVLADSSRTRLEVEEGKVQLRDAAGKSVLVDAGHGATTSDWVSKPLQKTLFADTFENSPRNQWPKGWIKAPTPNAAQRSSYVVIEDAGKRYMGCIGTPPAWTQHAAIPWEDWGAVGKIEFKLRTAGPRNGRAGMLVGGAVDEFFLEYDATNSAVKVESTHNRVLQQVPLRVSPGTWMDWSIAIERSRLRLAIDRKSILDVDLKDYGPVQGGLLVSRGEDSAHFDDFKLLRR